MDDQGRWAQNRRRLGAYRATVLVYLFYVGEAVAQNEHGVRAVGGFAILVAFAACWLAIPMPGSMNSPRRFWAIYGVLVALMVAELPFAHAQAFVMAAFITIPTVGRLGVRAAPIVIALTLAALLVPPAVPSWNVSLATAWDDITPAAIPVVALLTFALQRALQDSQALAEARAELASLAAENERFRIARDLHDLLGHSLTTITVKAGLAARLGAGESRPGDPGDDGGGGPGQADARRRPRHRVQLSRRRRWPGNSLTDGSCCERPASRRTCPVPSTTRIPCTRSCSAGWCERGSPTSSGTPAPPHARSGCPHPRSRSWTTGWAARHRPGTA